MRGKAPCQPFLLLRYGITPAYAGKSSFHDTITLAGRDHPRLCGEKTAVCFVSKPPEGSPPPMRGKVAVSTSNGSRHGITPAYAGKSYLIEKMPQKKRDHPRLCGEKYHI